MQPGPPQLTLPRRRSLTLASGPRLMGIVNLTPDSFSDGGRWASPAAAVRGGLEMLADGADLLDLGAESTRPGGADYGAGARSVDEDEELARLLPVLAGLRAQTDAPLSVDTRKGRVARAALAHGADLINDVSAGADPELLAAVAEAGCPLVLMHSRGSLATMQKEIHYDDLLGEIRAELEAAVDRAVAAGVGRDQLLIDPGIGFGKTYAGNVAILAGLGELSSIGLPLLVGASRKSFIGHLTGGAPPGDRLAGSLAALAWAALAAAAVVRVHDVLESARFLRVFRAVLDQTEAAR